MEAMKDQMTFMIEAMLSMKRMMESNAAAVAATRVAAEVDPTHPSTINQANQPIPNMVGHGVPHMGQNRNAFPYGLPPNYTPPNAVHLPNENANHAVPILFEGQQPQLGHTPFAQPVGDAREEPRDHV